MAASGFGSLLAALSLAFRGAPARRSSASARSSSGACEIALGWSTSFALSLVLMFAVGFGAILMAATANTTVQLAVPDGLRGRVMSVYTTVFAGSTPIGGPIMGGIASVFGIAVSLAVGGVLSFGSAAGRSPGCAVTVRTGFRASASFGDGVADRRRARRRPGPRRPRAASRSRSTRVSRGPASAGRSAEDEGGIQAAEPERGRQHAPVAPVAPSRRSRAGAPRPRDPASRGWPRPAPSRRGSPARRSPPRSRRTRRADGRTAPSCR